MTLIGRDQMPARTPYEAELRERLAQAEKERDQYMRLCAAYETAIATMDERIREARTGIPASFLKAAREAPSILDVLEDPNGPAATPLFPGLFEKDAK